MASLLFMLLFGLVLLVLGGEAMVRGASRLAALAGVSPLVTGLTVIAFSTSAPELAVTVSSALEGEPDLAIGNIVGSNIANILMNLGVAAVLTPVVVNRQLIRTDVPVMIFASLLMFGMAWDLTISRAEGLILIVLLLIYVVTSVRAGREADSSEPLSENPVETPPPTRASWLINGGFVALGVILLVAGGRVLVESAVEVAGIFGISELVIGLTVVAIGTSLPELAVVVIARIRGENELAVGNLIGSNIFNIFCVLGLTALITPVGVAPAAFGFDMPVMIAVAVACLPVFFTNHHIERWEGALFLLYFVIYTGYLVLRAAEHDALNLLSNVTLLFVMPLTVVTLGVVTIRFMRQSAQAQDP